MLPDLSFEKKLWDRGYSLIIGVDEVGRGSLAGPVVAGACALRIENHESRIMDRDFDNKNEKDNNIHDSCFMIPDSILKLGINDSKKLSKKRREEIDPEIKKYFYWAVGEADVGVINRFGIKPATEKAMRQAIIKLLYQVLDTEDKITSKTALSRTAIENMRPFLLLDAFQVKYIPIIGLACQQAIVKGDEKSITIAAASVVAKVYRDNLMRNLSVENPDYGWAKNKGYGTKDHILAIRKHTAMCWPRPNSGRT
ncbi:hypothetical protein COV53_01755, partial [Candidatus Gottesmanbacteria bacterium CG11_big_fil_rev_8_21_14_0_20_37_11]